LEALSYLITSMNVGGIQALESLARHPLDVLTRPELGDIGQVAKAFNEITVFVRYCQPHFSQPRSPVVLMLDALWPHLDRIINALGASEKVMEVR